MGVKSLYDHPNGKATLTMILFESRFRLALRERAGLRLLEEPPFFYQPMGERGMRLHSADGVSVRPDYGGIC